GHRVAVQYEYDKQGRMNCERQTVQHPGTGELLWQHETKHDYPEGLATRTTPDNLSPVEWLTYGSGYLAGMKLGDTPLIDFTRDRLHREIQRTAGTYERNTLYSATGQLLSHTFSDPVLNREYGYNDNGQLVRIRGVHQEEDYRCDGAGRLISARHNDLLRRHATDPAGNRITDREQYPALPAMWRDNRISEDVAYFYHHDAHGRLTEKDERQIRDGGGYVHHYHYDNRHRLVHYRREQQGITLLESRYLYDPPGRRIGKRVWKSRRTYGEITGNEYIQLSHAPEVTWYGWDGDRLTTTETATQRVQTIYTPGSFTPLVRIETETAELAKAVRRTLAEKFQQEANVIFPPELVAMVDSLEAELQRGELSAANRAWLAQCGLTPEQIQNQMKPEYTPERKIHLYHCDHRGLPLALVNAEGKADWSAEYDAWGNVLREINPHKLAQLLRLPGQQYDEETGLYYNRHRYYDPLQGRYITQDPIGGAGGWNLYQYPLNPVSKIDPLGLSAWSDAKSGACTEGICRLFSPFIGPEKFSDPDTAALDALKKINGQSICEDKEFAGLICMDNKKNYFATEANRGEEHESSPFDSPCPGSTVIATYHTHGAYSFGYADDFFSKRDVGVYEYNNVLGYLGTPGGEFKKTDKSGKELFSKKELTTVCRIHAN
ncbi:RHS repeat protein, partial [Salmonella enterica]|nr:RHS repeat protein [Salmonella enterica]ELT3086584.1 RHS repeat protein [Salmonella enterica]